MIGTSPTPIDPSMTHTRLSLITGLRLMQRVLGMDLQMLRSGFYRIFGTPISLETVSVSFDATRYAASWWLTDLS